jgi:ABC-2 type transport system ATP-binding protein
MQNPAAAWQNLKFSYPNKAAAIKDLSLTIETGETLALLGPNGAGKSTAIKLLLGLLRADQGQVRVFGADPALASTRADLGVVLQVSGLPNKLTVREQLALHACYFPNAGDPDALLQKLAIAPLATRRLDALSGGERRRFEFAMALIGNPKLLILDEPTAGVDIHERVTIMQLLADLKRAGTTMLLTTHLIDEAEQLADRVAYLAEGELKFLGTVAALRNLVTDTDVVIDTVRDLGSVEGLIAARIGGASVNSSPTSGLARWHIKTAAPSELLRRLLNEDANAQVISVQPASLAAALSQIAHPSNAGAQS